MDWLEASDAGSGTWAMYRRARNWEPLKLLARAEVVSEEPGGELRLVLPVRVTPKVRRWSEFLRTRIADTNRFYKRRWNGYGTSLQPGYAPVKGEFGCVARDGVTDDPRPAYELSAWFVGFIVDRGESISIGFVNFHVELEIQPAKHTLRPEVGIHAVWIDPMFRRQRLSDLLSDAVESATRLFLEALPAPARPQNVIELEVVGDVESPAGGRFVDKCAESLDFEWVVEGSAPRGWVVSGVHSDHR